jgi:hypothetical protein
MKTISEIALAAVSTSLILTTIASADDPQLQNRRCHTTREESFGRTANNRGRLRCPSRSQPPCLTAQGERTETRFEWRTKALGQQFGAYVEAR